MRNVNIEEMIKEVMIEELKRNTVDRMVELATEDIKRTYKKTGNMSLTIKIVLQSISASFDEAKEKRDNFIDISELEEEVIEKVSEVMVDICLELNLDLEKVMSEFCTIAMEEALADLLKTLDLEAPAGMSF